MNNRRRSERSASEIFDAVRSYLDEIRRFLVWLNEERPSSMP